MIRPALLILVPALAFPIMSYRIIMGDSMANAALASADAVVAPVPDAPSFGMGDEATYSVILERPIFSPSRHPLASHKAHASAEDASGLSLLGVVSRAGRAIALIRTGAAGPRHKSRAGPGSCWLAAYDGAAGGGVAGTARRPPRTQAAVQGGGAAVGPGHRPAAAASCPRAATRGRTAASQPTASTGGTATSSGAGSAATCRRGRLRLCHSPRPKKSKRTRNQARGSGARRCGRGLIINATNPAKSCSGVGGQPRWSGPPE